MDVATPQAIPVETTTPIKPSEALRLGRLTRPVHAHFAYLKGSDAACAVGAIHIGFGGNDSTSGSTFGIPNDLWDTVTRFPEWGTVSEMYEAAEDRGKDGDAVVLAWLEEKGL